MSRHREEDPCRDYYKEWIEQCDVEDANKADEQRRKEASERKTTENPSP